MTGEWKVEPPQANATDARICWKYGPETNNPVTQSRGGTYHCVNAKSHLLAEEEYTGGDVFGLRDGIPYTLEPDRRYTFAQVAAPLSISVTLYR